MGNNDSTQLVHLFAVNLSSETRKQEFGYKTGWRKKNVFLPERFSNIENMWIHQLIITLLLTIITVAHSKCASKKTHMDMMTNTITDVMERELRRCVICTLWKKSASPCEYCFADGKCRESKGSTCDEDLSAKSSVDNSLCKNYIKVFWK